MSWTRKQKIVRTNQQYKKAVMNNRRYMDSLGQDGVGAAGNKFSSTLPEVYAGNPMRIERYTQYDQMDMDSEVHTALGIIANYCTQDDPDSDLKFSVNYNESIADSEIEGIEILLRQWCKMNRFKKRLWRMVRSTLKYGDQFYLRDPETLEWYFIPPDKVEKVLVNEAEGKEIEAYIVRDLDINRTMQTAGQVDTYGSDLQGASTNTLQNQVGYQNRYGNVTHYGKYSDGIQNVIPIAAEHIIHLSLSEDMEASWPFGTSILESVFKVFRQKELLEDAILIYRIQRAPERRVFYVDVGQIPANRANSYLERFKNEIHQRRIPSRSGGSETVVDTSYQPLSQIDDYFFAVGEGGRSSRVEILPGGENLGTINDLVWWNNKLIRGLGVPAGYLPYGPEDGGVTVNDGRLGTAYQQEFNFAQYCMRLQNLVVDVFDREFKLFCKQRGMNIDSSSFNIDLITPQHFSEYAKIERDAAAISNFTTMAGMPFISPRFAMETWLGMSKAEIAQNERYVLEENPEEETPDDENDDNGFSSIGIRDGGGDFGGDMDFGDDMDSEGPDDTGSEESPISGDESGDSGLDLPA